MPLNPVLVKIFNAFADSQPGLQIPGAPAGDSSNPKLGDLLAADFARQDAEIAALKALTAKLDLDSGVTDEDYHAITNPLV